MPSGSPSGRAPMRHLAIAMAYVIINENLQDQNFLDKYTIGFDAV